MHGSKEAASAADLMGSLVARYAPIRALAEAAYCGANVQIDKELADGMIEFASDLREAQRRVEFG